ncbi:MAG: hypothetical protein ACREID_09780 [Planctomycetota bacterium]
MRSGALWPLLCVAAAALVGGRGRAYGRPEFARREDKACGFCHINPRGGGPRNETGLAYARNDFRFPPRTGELADFAGRDRDAMARVRRMLDVQHIPDAVRELTRLSKSVKGEAPRRRVEEELHRLDVKGWDILGRARLLLRGEDVAQGVELLALLSEEYRGLSVHAEASKELKELRADKEMLPLVEREAREAKARRAYLDAALDRAEGRAERARESLRKLVEAHPGTRAAEAAEKELA